MIPHSALQEVKLWLVDHLGLAKDALHVHIGLMLFFGAALLFRWRLSSWKPWAVVAAVAIVGEIWDIRDSVAYKSTVHYSANWHDIWNTMVWPTAILLLARGTRLLDH